MAFSVDEINALNVVSDIKELLDEKIANEAVALWTLCAALGQRLGEVKGNSYEGRAALWRLTDVIRQHIMIGTGELRIQDIP